MLQIIFNAISASEMASLPTDLQLELLAEFQQLPENLERLDPERFGAISRDGKTLRRCRAKDFRIYFETAPEGLVIHRVLSRNTIRDFLFRSALPMVEPGAEEDRSLEEKPGFWKLIEEGEKARKA